MSNPLKGEVTFDAQGETYTLAFPINSLIALEERLGCGIVNIGDQLNAGATMGTIRALFWAGLIANHNLTEADAGELMDEIGLAEAATLAGQSLSQSMPSAGGGKSSARPRKAAVGTGKVS